VSHQRGGPPIGAQQCRSALDDPRQQELIILLVARFNAEMSGLVAQPQWRGRDIDDPTEIAEMVRRFYADVAQDDLLGPMFNDVARVDWSEHIPKLTAFWCRALLSQPGYSGNPYRAHLMVHAKRSFTAAHFERWLDLFHEALELGWSGPKVEQAKAFARKVAAVHAKQIVEDAGSAPAPAPVELRRGR
jgi:hemoglobin